MITIMKMKLLIIMFLLIGLAGNVKAQEVIIDQVKYTISGNVASVTGYEGEIVNANIVENVTYGSESYPVTSIGYKAFYDCSSLESIDFPSGIISIGNYAFFGCSLQSIILPSGITEIENGIFSGCSSLQSIYVPLNVTSIGSSAFYECSNLQEIIVSPDNFDFASIDGVLVNKEKNKLIACPQGKTGTYEVPEGIIEIEVGAFTCCNLQSINLPSTVNRIGPFAFQCCRNLQSMVFPSSVTYIEFNMFFNCSSLQEVTIGYGVTDMKSGIFAGCMALTDIYCLASIPPSAESDTFDNYNTILHVPTGSKVAYAEADYWRNFRDNIIEDAGPVSIENMQVSSVITYIDGILFLKGLVTPATISVYTIEGKYIETCQMSADDESCDLSTLPEGAYIIQIKAGDKTEVLKIMK